MRQVRDLICPRCFARRAPSASTCWRCGEPFVADATAGRSSPTTEVGPTESTRAGRIWMLTAFLALVVGVLCAAWYVRSTGFLPERAADFSLVWSRTVRSGLTLGPPVSSSNDLRVVEERLGMYAHDEGLVEVRVTEIDTSAFSTRELLRAQLLDDGTHRWATTELGVVPFTCGGNGASRWCFWSTASHFGRVSTAGYPAPPSASISSLRRLAIALHGAVS